MQDILFLPVVIQLGFVITMAGVAVLYKTLGVHATVTDFAPGLFLYGLGMGFGFSQLSNLTLSAVSVQQSGEASGVNNTLRQVGASFGSAIIGAALIATLTSSVVKNIESNNVIPDQAKTAVIENVRSAGSNIEFQAQPDTSKVPAYITAEVVKNTHEATIDGNKVALLFTGGFALLALLFSNLLPNIRDLETGEEAKVTSAH